MKHKSASHSALIGLLIVLAFAAYSSPARAATTVWTGGGDGEDWFDGANWSAGEPHSCLDAVINNGGKAGIGLLGAMAGTLTLGANAADSGSVKVDGSGRLDVGAPIGGSCEAPLVPGPITVGNAGRGTLSITNGGKVISGEGYIARGGVVGEAPEGANGAVTVDGDGSRWTLNGQLFIGTATAVGLGTDGGIALLNVTNGGTVVVNNPSAALEGVSVGISGTLTGNGTLTVNSTGAGGTLRSIEVNGTLAPTGTLQINGALALRDRATTLCTVTPQGSDRVNVSGTGSVAGWASLNGHLIVILSGTFTPGPDCTRRFTLLDAETMLSLEFDSVSIQGIPLNAPYTAQITYDYVADNVYLDLVFNPNQCE